jgi:predicted DNA-binding protein
MALGHIQLVMKRTTIWLTPMQANKLNSLSKNTGIKVAELIRRYVDEGLKKEK